MARSPWILLLVFAAGLAVGAWYGRNSAPPTAASPDPALARTPVASVPATPASGAPEPPPLTVAERQALQVQEAAHSTAAPPAASYRGIDGKPRAFRYPDPLAAESAERNRQARREQLMRELAADPARFAREHGLSLKQVQWIVDGEADFPDEMLEP